MEWDTKSRGKLQLKSGGHCGRKSKEGEGAHGAAKDDDEWDGEPLESALEPLVSGQVAMMGEELRSGEAVLSDAWTQLAHAA